MVVFRSYAGSFDFARRLASLRMTLSLCRTVILTGCPQTEPSLVACHPERSRRIRGDSDQFHYTFVEFAGNDDYQMTIAYLTGRIDSVE